MEIVIIVIAALWLWSFIKFRRKYKMDKTLCEFLRLKYEEHPSAHTQVEYASGLMMCQRYSDALPLFEDLQRKGTQIQFDFLPENIAFCKRPLPWSKGAKNYNGSWWHNFLLVRFGGRRLTSISRETLLEANAMLRMMDRMNKS